MHFTRLRLLGFKSFVEPTDLAIEPGLTGVVGPNGCGKSNLVEALRWVMGETSARQMRGGEMDDVIFGGTADRPARNLAEVQLHMDNTDRRAPAAFNDLQDIEVVRRIERGEGSAYKVNGRDVRARDVQLLFADAATGAHSPSLVSQGRVGALINAKPVDRRAILEDAAGIAGLHSRRHEAELRLKAAETNLGRLEDVLTTLDAQLQGLKKQARQAARYRTVSESIRKLEAVLLALHWSAAVKGREEAGAALEIAEQAVAEATAVAAQAATVQANAAASLPPLRQAEVEAAAELHRLTLASGELEAEVRRITDATRAVAERLVQIGRDVERETQLAQDAETALARLAEEEQRLLASQEAEQESLATAAASLETAEQDSEAADQLLSQASQKLAANEVMRASIDRRLGDLANRQARLSREQQQVAEQRARIAAELVSPERLEAAREGLAQAAARL
ncbi:MAG: AAA family ATPase, partial [Alphaproteobacteria bacterium]|nr:AAA family ATPase [Alphaproteobacteria bacterium]